MVKGRTLILLLDETGDCKKGNITDYVKRQYIGNVGKKENGIVAVTAYGLVDDMILPLSFEVYKPRERLRAGDKYPSKPKIAAAQIEKWWEMVMSAFLMVSLFAETFNDSCPLAHQHKVRHPWWNKQNRWKPLLNNLRLIIQPLVCFNWLQRWLEVFPITSLQFGFERLISKMNRFVYPVVHQLNCQFEFSSV